MVSQTDDITEPAPLNRVYYWLSKDDGLTWSERKLIIPKMVGLFIKQKHCIRKIK